ncbi:MAG: alpha/beta hydrolase [Gammaproteobacteria bacterium]|nr:MAG: alpha/beta hydrolase [Gammaproteobacteria bacterium]RKZ72128.1 MAG: alpha/beta hydrolase [Gammaproteobacteria bacterium]
MLHSIVFILVSVWVLLSLLLYLFQPKFVYFPLSEIDYTPDMAGLAYEDIYFKTEDDVELNAWFIPVEGARKTLLFFHGNGGNISHRLDSLKIFHELGLSVFIIDYRGYGQSQGTTSEQGTYKDAEAAWQYLTESRGIPDKDIIIFGRSMGGGVATWLSIQHTPDLLILESTFTSVADMAKHYYPYLPAHLLTRIKYASIDRIGAIQCPILFSHSQTDEIVPFELGLQLFKQAQAPKMFMQLEGGHNDGFIVTGRSYVNGIKEFLNTYGDTYGETYH